MQIIRPIYKLFGKSISKNAQILLKEYVKNSGRYNQLSGEDVKTYNCDKHRRFFQGVTAFLG